MKKLISILFFVLSLNSFSQTSNNIERSFIQHFIQENILVIKKVFDKEYIYNPEVISIEIDTLGYYGTDFLFCKFELGKNMIQSIDKNLDIYFNSSSCSEYIAGYNIINNEFYRIKGFYGNDLFSLLKSTNQSSIEQMSIKKTLSELNEVNIGINFKDIYNALRTFHFNADCLKVCATPKEAHGEIK